MQILIKCGKSDEKVDSYSLMEDVPKSWDPRDMEKGGGVPRTLDMDEKILLAQSKWKGSGRFILRKHVNVRYKF